MLVRPLAPLDFFVVLVMLSIGLRVSGGELVDVLRNRALFFRTLLANCVFIPGLGFLLVKIFPLTPDASVGILLLAAIPGTPIALQFRLHDPYRLSVLDGSHQSAFSPGLRGMAQTAACGGAGIDCIKTGQWPKIGGVARPVI